MNANYVVVQLDQTETVESEGQKEIPAVRESPERPASQARVRRFMIKSRLYYFI